MQCHNRLNCDALYTDAEIANLTPNDINEVCNEYLDSTLSDATTKGLGEATIPKLTGIKWMKFKTTMTELLSRIIGKIKILSTYLIRENVVWVVSMHCIVIAWSNASFPVLLIEEQLL